MPIIISSLSGFIVAGHGRLEAIKSLNLEVAPIEYQDFSSLDQEYAFMISDNALQMEFAELDKSMI